jgi:hypothetical protein
LTIYTPVHHIVIRFGTNVEDKYSQQNKKGLMVLLIVVVFWCTITTSLISCG